jgi:hypothetical protein
MKRTGPSEKEITLAIRQLLKTFGIFHWKVWGGPMSVKGVPDILGIYKGRMIGIEVKTPRGIVSPEQERFIRRINEEGGLAFIARDVQTVIEKLELQGRFLFQNKA